MSTAAAPQSSIVVDSLVENCGHEGLIPQCDLGPDSLLQFVHIPKTAGTSIRKFLDIHFSPHEVFPAEVVIQAYPGITDDHLFERLDERRMGRYRLLRGHHTADVTRPFLSVYKDRIVRFTVLREPMSQLISEYGMCLHDPAFPLRDEFLAGPATFSDYLRFFKFRWVWRGDRQASHVVKQVYPTEQQPPRADWARLAQAQLESYAMVGIFERLHDSVELLAYILGWEAPAAVGHLNKSMHQGSLPELSAEDRALIDERYAGDRQLFQRANARFDLAYRQMLHDLGLTDAPDEIDRETLRARINAHAAARREARLSACPKKDHYETISTEGVILCFIDRTRGMQVEWIGPEPRAVMRFGFVEPSDRLLLVEVQYWLTEQMLDDLRATVNGVEVRLARQADGNRQVFTGFVPRQAIEINPRDARLELTTSSVNTPADLGLNPEDNETKCLALSAIQFISP
ncbi:MAG: sulfotransferase family 2 domain-containing protein [Planctomycetota bacterium]